MRKMKLSSTQRRVLQQEVLRRDSDASKVRRAEALLWRDQGEKVTDIARRLGVERGTIYNWARCFEETGQLTDRFRSGRPAEKTQRAQPLIQDALSKAPRDLGFQGYIWTAPMLHKHLKLAHELNVSTDTIRRALHALNLSFQRARFSLARESPTWRQAKGGFKEA
jgi:transposase